MKKYQKFIAKHYLKNFLIIYFALQLFFIGMDLMQNIKYINSANLQILYVANEFLYYTSYTLPLSLIFSMIMTIFNILKSNELVSLYSLGVSKDQLIQPIMVLSVFLTLFYTSFNFIPDFINAKEKAKNIKKYNNPYQTTSSLFLKSHNTYAYIDKLFPNQKEGKNLKIFITKNNRLIEILEAKNAIFKNNSWQLKDVKSIKIPNLKSNIEDAKLILTTSKTKEVLHGFQPKIIDTLFKTSSKLTIQDSFTAINLLNKQSLNSDKVKSNLYTMIFFPFFAPIIIYGLFFSFPIQRRGSNLSIVISGSILAILSIWGILFTLSKMSANGSLKPEVAIIVPILILAFVSSLIARKYRVMI